MSPFKTIVYVLLSDGVVIVIKSPVISAPVFSVPLLFVILIFVFGDCLLKLFASPDAVVLAYIPLK